MTWVRLPLIIIVSSWKQSSNCENVTDDLSINIFAKYQGVRYGFTLNYSPVAGDPAGLYWKMDMGTFMLMNPVSGGDQK